MTTQCEFCGKPNEGNHLLECGMVVAHLFSGNTTLCISDEVTIQLVDTVKRVRKLATLRWKNIRELCSELGGDSSLSSTMLYT